MSQLSSSNHVTNDLVIDCDCGICYSYQLYNNNNNINNEIISNNNKNNINNIPDIICNNEKCGKSFHTVCIIEWLTSIPTSRTSFGTLFGTCPYCQEAISVRTLI